VSGISGSNTDAEACLRLGSADCDTRPAGPADFPASFTWWVGTVVAAEQVDVEQGT
jgi:hypothetical protein